MAVDVESVEALQAQLIALNKARASGHSSFSYMANGTTRTVTYKSDVEMQGAQNDLRRRIAELQGSMPRTIKVSSSKGFCEPDRD
jgi:multidrug efflux pump subunit AcrB